ncbi:ECF-type sigma factor [Streptomyces fungicidicus]|uniref:ECF-type sigma factor n=1 Tax=Streptomyces fungicidicus TaxID=68203 RepID=UPI00384C36EE
MLDETCSGYARGGPFDNGSGLQAWRGGLLRQLEESLVETQDGEHAEPGRQRGEADSALVAFLRRRGFEGPHYRRFVGELMEYGWLTLCRWSGDGQLFRRSAQMGRPVPAGMVLGAWAYEDRSQVVTDTVIAGSALFREHGLVRGKWTPEGGASLTTYFVGASILAFRPVYTRWYRTHHLGQSELDHRRAGTEDALSAQQDLPDPNTPDPSHVAAVHDEVARLRPLLPNEQLREALGWIALGYTQKEAAAQVGLTPKALERRLKRARTKVAASGLHQVRLALGKGGTR